MGGIRRVESFKEYNRVKDVYRRRAGVIGFRCGVVYMLLCGKESNACLGFAVWHKDGLHLLNASQLHKKVVEEPMTLEQYLSRHPSFTGIRVVQLL